MHPQGVSEQPVSKGLMSSTSQPLIKLSKDVINDMVKATMKLITCKLFSNNAMTISKASKKVMLTKVIQDVVLCCFGHNVVFEDFILNKHCMHVANVLLVTCGKFIEFACDGIFNMEEEKLTNLRYIWVLAGTATFCSLDKEAKDTVEVDHFRGKACNKKFLTILNAMDNQMDDEQAEFQRFLQYVLVVGPTQAPSL
ncbi:hypothetical protein BDR04DRAFT_1116460 [Suillus decipiens]|nr:hypothetical protein BDR04DRAFT_1116460 [Suillus decipiens]